MSDDDRDDDDDNDGDGDDDGENAQYLLDIYCMVDTVLCILACLINPPNDSMR